MKFTIKLILEHKLLALVADSIVPHHSKKYKEIMYITNEKELLPASNVSYFFFTMDVKDQMVFQKCSKTDWPVNIFIFYNGIYTCFWICRVNWVHFVSLLSKYLENLMSKISLK